MPLIEKFEVKAVFYIYNKNGQPSRSISLFTSVDIYENSILEIIEDMFAIGVKSFIFSFPKKYNNNVEIVIEKSEKAICVFQRGNNGLSRSKSIIDINKKNRNQEILDFLYETKWSE